MEKRKRESSGESEAVSSQSDIQPESTMESHDDENQLPKVSLEVENETNSQEVSLEGETENEARSPQVSLELETENEVRSPEVSVEAETENEKKPLSVSLEVEAEIDDLKESVRTLTEKLSAALANVSAKDELVKQHVKVAEEAVAGWEKAENEAVELKEKLEAADDENNVLEDRVSHLDGALKECVRQLRQARDELEQRIQDAVIERTQELESSRTSLENQILEAANKFEELGQMAESVAKENVMLRHELLARCEELEIRTIERDLSTQAAETASKQQLDSIKKVAKLEAECRKLRMLAKSSASCNDHRSTDSHSDGGERMDVSCSESWTSSALIEKRSLQGTSSSVEIDLMGDFLEMERLVALPEKPDGNGKSGPESVTEEAVVHTDSLLHAEIEALTCRTKELEEKLEKLQAEKDELESEVKCNREVESTLRFELEAILCDKLELENKFEKMEVEKAELQISFDIIKDKYKESQVCLQEIELKLEEIQMEMKLTNELKREVESQIFSMEAEVKTKSAKIESLEEDMRKERFGSDELRGKCEALEKEMKLAYELKEEVESQIIAMEAEAKTKTVKIESLKEDMRKERLASDELRGKCEALEKEMKLASELKAEVESQIISMEAEAKTKSAMMESLEEDMRKERLASDELRQKCEILEEEVSRHQENTMKQQNIESKIKQEDIETAAGKLANCQKTIASLGKQLQSLATLEDFLIDTASIPVAANGVSSSSSNNTENWKVLKNQISMTRNHPKPIKPARETSDAGLLAIKNTNGNSNSSTHAFSPPSSSSVAASSVPVSSNRGSSEKNRNGFAKVFTRSKDGIHLAI